jgi:hypothetical protein
MTPVWILAIKLPPLRDGAGPRRERASSKCDAVAAGVRGAIDGARAGPRHGPGARGRSRMSERVLTMLIWNRDGGVARRW